MRTDAQARTAAWKIVAVFILFAAGLTALSRQRVFAQAGQLGQWTTLPYTTPINPVHMALLNTGNVLIVSGSGWNASETNFRAALWNRQTGAITTQSLAWDMFCNAMVVLFDGRPFINGGNLKYNPFLGEPRNAVYDPATGAFTDVQNMAHGRWYPTATTLGDGRVMTFSGLNETGGTNTAVEIYAVGSGWSPEYQAGWAPPLYPWLHLMPNGNVFYSGYGTGSRIFNTSTKTWSDVVATTNYPNVRNYGSSVLLPLTPANGYKARAMIFGGGDPATATTEIIDLSASPLQWVYGPSMTQPRIQMNATILPDGKVLAVGGSLNNEDAATAGMNADLYNPNTNGFSSAGVNAYPHLYHSGALLLPDATVMLAGGNPTQGTYEPHIEIYSPAYLFNGDGSPATRPTISSLSSSVFSHGSTFQVQTPEAANITSVVLVRPGATTHAFDMEQRLIGLSYTTAAGLLNVTVPPNGNIAPPGYYMLFILNSAGTPSLARFVKITTGGNVDFGISATPTSVTITKGSNASYTVTITAIQGFTGTVALSVTGLPKFAGAQFNPSSVVNSGNSILTVTTNRKVAAGTYSLNIKGTSGSRVHSTSVNLVIQ